MKMRIQQLPALLVIAISLLLSGYSVPHHDNQLRIERAAIKAKPPFTYVLSTTWENTYIDNSTYIEYKSFRVNYSVPLPYDVTISYNLYIEDANGGTSNIEYFATGTKGSTSTYLGYYETYHQDLNNNTLSTLDLILNYVQ
jgi:hypothetical protein